ncbi:hypothetical protein CU254_26195 [Amycolatopsis sp. AA4]|uniref:hypothetical protein n=1 Tax=Actinomycetes TaxID=1760 RepID=UPI0001B550AE|nr:MULTISPECIES: hypothetical protein [Actinomycetes]ATY13527.1 hypothetical protein CU254_26195 [Amycolatopsis sp. AA4]EFL09487.1 predicted protein [Streptomyces sp. AA4]
MKPESDRRTFLARIGLLGAAVAAGGLLAPAGGRAQTLDDVVAGLRPVLGELARDTLNGLVVMTCPGPDAYSKAQGTPRGEPGALEARATDFMITSLDHFVPFPDQLGAALAQGLAAGLDGSGVVLPGSLAGLPLGSVRTLDDALTTLLGNNATLPLSSVVALLLNLVATQANPASVNGLFLSPFARLSFADKCRAFELLEGPDPDLLSTLDSKAPAPFTETLSGVLRFLAGALFEVSAYGSYGEWGVYDAKAKTITRRPVGWELSGYQPDGVVHGWDEFKGYYQGRKKVAN